MADAVGHLFLSLRLDEAPLSVPLALSEFVVDVLGVDLDTEGHWYLSDIPPYGVIDTHPFYEGKFRSFKKIVMSV